MDCETRAGMNGFMRADFKAGGPVVPQGVGNCQRLERTLRRCSLSAPERENVRSAFAKRFTAVYPLVKLSILSSVFSEPRFKVNS
jgi:hypothetical protein